MPTTSIIFGTLLLLVGMIGYAYGAMYSEYASLTALIPAAFGILLIILGSISQKKESLRKHLMHAAIIVALLGFIATAARLVPRLSRLTFTAAEVSQIATAVICLLFVILAIKSFADARRNKA
ncbi:MAG: hypothetical protein H7070_05200 [Saprospiraceae bacterium]|nr:hypothetical protein [Pyrinomonadaceae bacterium]